MISISNLKLTYISKEKKEVIITYPEIHFREGKINILIGENGSGKSTLGNYMFRINSVERIAGSFKYNSIELENSIVNYGFKLIPQERPFTDKNLTCNDIFNIFRNTTKKKSLNGFSFDKKLLQKDFCNLSVGEWKKFLVYNIVNLNKLKGMFLDELFAGLNEASKNEILNLLIKKNSERNLTTIVTHINLDTNSNDSLINNLNKFENHVNKIYL